jgi:hypothetical protein
LRPWRTVRRGGVSGLWSLISCDRVGWRRVWPVKCATSGGSGGKQAGARDYHRAGSTQHGAMQSWTGMPPVDRLDEVGRWESSRACTGLHRLARRNRGRAVVTAVRGSCRRASRAPAAPPPGQSRAAPLPKSQHQEAAEKGSVTGNAAGWRAPSQSRSLADQIPGPRSQIPVPCCDLT